MTGNEHDAEVENAVRNQVAQTCYTADEGTLDELTALMAEDVVWESSAGPLTGRAAVAAGLQGPRERGLTGPGSGTRHLLTTVVVRAGADRSAESRSTWALVKVGDEPKVLMVGEYVDSWTWSAGGPLLQQRRIVRAS